MGVDAREPVMHELIDADAPLERLVGGFGFIEGPLWLPDGHLLFTDIPGNAIMRWSEADGSHVWRQPSGHANGLGLTAGGDVVACEHDRSVIVRLDAAGGGEVLASHFGSKELNSPNDLAVAADGSILFTDPHPAGRTADWGVERPQELDFNGAFRLEPHGGAVALIAGDFAFPNGLCLSPDESILYVNDTLCVHIREFRLSSGWVVESDRVLITMGPEARMDGALIIPGDPTMDGLPDGMKCDARGNVWCSGPGGIWVVSPAGDHLGTVEVPEFAANLAWGGPDRSDLFVTASTTLYRIRTRVPGA